MAQRSLVVVLLLACTITTASAQTEKRQGWASGPTAGRLGKLASISIPEGYTFLDAQATKRFLEEGENIPGGDEHQWRESLGEDQQWKRHHHPHEQCARGDGQPAAVGADIVEAPPGLRDVELTTSTASSCARRSRRSQGVAAYAIT